MRVEPMYQQLERMHGKLQAGLEALRGLQGKNLVLIIGPSGSGKSTLANALLQGSGKIEYDEDNGDYKVTNELHYDGRKMFAVTRRATSCTEVPGYYPLDGKDDTFLVDCPGFGDSNQYLELPN